MMLLKTTAAQLVHIVYEHDAIVHHRAHQYRKAHEREHGKAFAAEPQRKEATREGQRNGKDDDEGQKEALELQPP